MKPNARMLIFALSTLLVVACGRDNAELAPVIPEETLTTIIAEALILEPAGREVPLVKQDSVYQKYYAKILAHHGYDMADFISSMQWLQKDPKRLQRTYTAVLEKIDTLETK